MMGWAGYGNSGNDNNQNNQASKLPKRTDEYSDYRFYVNPQDVADLKEIITTISNKVYITETSVLTGTNVQITGPSKEYVDYVLYEIEKIKKKKAELNVLADKTKSNSNGVICTTSVNERLEFNSEMKGLSWPTF